MSGDAARVVWIASGFDVVLRRAVDLFDARTRITRRIDADVAAPPVDSTTGYLLGLSCNGRYAVFASSAGGLVADGIGARIDGYLRDLDTWELTRLVNPIDRSSLSTITSPGDVGVSDDARIIAFASDIGRGAGNPQVLRLDRAAGRLDALGMLPGGVENALRGDSVTLTADGSRLAYRSLRTAEPASRFHQIWLQDAGQASPTLVSRDAAGNAANHDSISPYLTGSGDTLVFASMATNLDGPPHPVGDGDIYLQRLPTIALFRSGFE